MNFAESVATWAVTEPTLMAVVLIGSRVQGNTDGASRADSNSDWDFQFICSDPALFMDSGWTRSLGVRLHTYSVRRAAIGGVPKVAALFEDVQADFVIIPAGQLRIARLLVKLGLHRNSFRLRRALQDIALIVRPGWRFLKGGKRWEDFYRRIVTDIPDPRLDNAEIRSLAVGFSCDVSWILKKIQRGEILAAQRMLHHSLAETNFRLLHELRLRRGEQSYPEARRGELILSDIELSMITVDATPNREALRSAVDKASSTCTSLVQALIGIA